MEQSNNNEQEKKKVNEDLVVFMRKRSDHEVPRYTARLKTYVDIQRKRRRAAAARRMSDHFIEKKLSPVSLRKKIDPDLKDKPDAERERERAEGDELRGHTQKNPDEQLVPDCNCKPTQGFLSRGRTEEQKQPRTRSFSRSSSNDDDLEDASCRRRRRRRKRKRRRRKRCKRKRRRRKRSCSRRRRRRSCRRRRRKRRRRRC